VSPRRSMSATTDTPYYPLLLNVSGKSCLVVGGGGVAERKVRILLKFNAAVKLVSPKATKNLIRLADAGRILLVQREYEEGDLEGTALVFAATSQEETNSRIKADAEARRIPVNVVDNPRLCDFIVPSIVRKGSIVIAISTSGTFPALSKKLRKLIAEEIHGDFARYASILGKMRSLLMTTEKDRGKRKAILKKLSEMDMKEVNRMGFRKIKGYLLAPHV
jgi:precorrin-2 dehydrogenase / sirohydrochlorin ferrochelatase